MGLLSTLLEPRHLTLEDPTVPLNSAFELLAQGQSSAAGVHVNTNSAERLSAWYSAVGLIASDIGSLPLKLFKRLDRGREPQLDNPLYDRLALKPSSSKMSAKAFRTAMVLHKINVGNAYAEMDRNGNDVVFSLLNPHDTQFVQNEGQPFYRISSTQRRIPYLNVWHDIGLSWDGENGRSVLTAAREAIALGLSSQQFAEQFYGSGMKQSMILSHPASLTEGAQKNLRESTERAGQRSHGVLVLQEGLTASSWQLSSEDAEFLQSQQWNVLQIARYLQIPPHKIGSESQVAYKSLVELNTDYLQSTLTPWLTGTEQSLAIQVLTDQDRAQGLYFKHELDGFLRGDPLKRAEQERNQFNTGSVTPNELRAQNERNALDIPQADEPWVQVNMVPMSEAQSMSVADRALLIHGPSSVPEGTSGQSVTERRATPLQVVRERRRIVRQFLPLLVDAFRRMITAEQQNVKRGLKFLDEWVGFLDTYYHEEMPGLAKRTVAPVMESMALAIADAASREVAGEFTEADIRNWMLRQDTGYVDRFTSRYSMSSRTQLQRIAENADDVETDTLQRFSEWDEGTDQGRPRAERWGQKEAGRLGNAVAVEVFAISGVMLLRWNTVGETCPMCMRLNGRTVGIRQQFLEQGETLTGTDDKTTISPKTVIRHPPLHGGCDCFVSAA